METSTNVLQEAVDRADIETLFALWKQSLTERKGADIRDYINKNLPYLSSQLGFSPSKNFHELVENYDFREFKSWIVGASLEDILTIIYKTNNKQILHYVAVNAKKIITTTKHGPTRGVPLTRVLNLLIQKGIEKEDFQLLKKLVKYYDDANDFFSIVALLAVENDNQKLLHFALTEDLHEKSDAKRRFEDVLTNIVERPELLKSLLQEAKSVNYVISIPFLRENLHSLQVFEILLNSLVLSKSLARNWSVLRTLLTEILDKDNSEEEDAFLDALFDYLDRVDSKLYNKAVQFVNNQ